MPGAIRPAPEVVLRHGPHAVTLRASLGALVALDRYPGSFGALVTQIARQSLAALHFSLRAAATDANEAERLLRYAERKPLGDFLAKAQAVCLTLLSSSLNEGQGEAPSPQSGPIKPFADHAADLYRLATGWLGWSPSEVWNASIAELEAAFLAHVDRVVKMTPGAVPANSDKDADVYTEKRLQEIEDQGFDPAFDREGLHRLKQAVRTSADLST